MSATACRNRANADPRPQAGSRARSAAAEASFGRRANAQRKPPRLLGSNSRRRTPEPCKARRRSVRRAGRRYQMSRRGLHKHAERQRRYRDRRRCRALEDPVSTQKVTHHPFDRGQAASSCDGHAGEVVRDPAARQGVPLHALRPGALSGPASGTKGVTMAIDKQTIAEILRLYCAEKWKVGTIARQLGIHHNTARRVAIEAGMPRHPGTRRSSKIDPFLPFADPPGRDHEHPATRPDFGLAVVPSSRRLTTSSPDALRRDVPADPRQAGLRKGSRTCYPGRNGRSRLNLETIMTCGTHRIQNRASTLNPARASVRPKPSRTAATPRPIDVSGPAAMPRPSAARSKVSRCRPATLMSR